MADDLIATLRAAHSYGEGDIFIEAADALEAKDKRIASLHNDMKFLDGKNDDLRALLEADRYTIDKLRARIAELTAALTQCADDLEAEIDGRYRILPGGTIHAATLADYDRDMATVREARWVLGGK